MSILNLAPYREIVADIAYPRPRGRIVQFIGLTIEAEGLQAQVGEVCQIHPPGDAQVISAEVIGFRDDRCVLMPFTEPNGLIAGAPVYARGRPFTVPAGDGLLGRVLDGFGRPLDGKGPLGVHNRIPLSQPAPHPLQRRRVTEPFSTGIRAIDGLLTCGRGQRMAILAGSGVGKSILLGMITRHAESDVNVVALIGERGREVQEFILDSLGEEGLARSVIIVATSDRPALERLKGAWTAAAIAEQFRDAGLNVAFIMDSVTRFAMAQREIGLAAGEPPTTKGYPPSVFSLLPKLLERTAPSAAGTITGFYTVLVESDDFTEPVTDTVRSTLDGHIHLSRELAHEQRFPAIDLLGSVSRVMLQITSPEHREHARQVRNLVAVYQNARDLINIGAYVPGSNAEIDRAVQLMPEIRKYLEQRPDERSSLQETVQLLANLAADHNAEDS